MKYINWSGNLRYYLATLALGVLSLVGQAQTEMDVCGTKDFFKEDNVIPSLKDTTFSRGTMDLSKVWPTGTTLRVKFLNGDTAQQRMVREYAPEWCQYANVRFEFVSGGDADVRIRFDSTQSNNSVIGTDAFKYDLKMPTVNFKFTASTKPYYARRYVLHEFGHVLGLLHEHTSPLSKIDWDMDKLYAYYQQESKWSKKEVDENILNKCGFTNGEYDVKSIMHYPIPETLLKSHQKIPMNFYLSDGDKKLAASLYPKDSSGSGAEQSPKVPYPMMTKIKTDDANLLIKPYFELQNANGYTFKVVAYFFDNDGLPVPDAQKSEMRSKDGQLITFAKVQPAANVVDFNKAEQNSMFLSIPLSNLPLKKNGLKYKIVVWSGTSSVYKSPMYELPLR